jgi:hypothetical protein
MPARKKIEDAKQLRLKAQEMLRLAHQTQVPEVAQELIQMAALMHESALRAEDAAKALALQANLIDAQTDTTIPGAPKGSARA